MRRFFIGFISVATLMLPAQFTRADGYIEEYEIVDEVLAHFDTLGVSAKVESYDILPMTGHTQQGGRVNGFEVWVDLRGCNGNLTLFLLRDGGLRNAYTRGDCLVEGVPTY